MTPASDCGGARWRQPRAVALLLCALLSCVFLAGCVTPTGVLTPTSATAPGATRLDILVATTRERSPDPGVAFSGERGETSYSGFSVSIPPDDHREVGQVQWPQSLPSDPSREFATLRVETLESWKQADSWLRAHSGRSRRVLVFIHGFNMRFESALFSFAQIFHDSGADAAPVLFSWPSRGNVFNYVYDRESATISRDALEKLFTRLVRDPNVDEVTVLAHSMGAWLTMESLRQMAIRDKHLPAKIDTVILASPDIDVDVFRAQLASFGPERPHIVVFLSREDRALRLSRSLGGNVARLGGVDSSEKPWIEEKGVEVVDLSGASAADPLRHSKFARDSNVVRFLGEELINGSAPDPRMGIGQRIGNISTGVAGGVGDAAGLVVNAPIAIVDPQFRRAYSSRVQRFWRNEEEPTISERDR